MKKVKEVSELTGVSVRTLHYYDEINLLKPSKVSESGYRFYDDVSLEILKNILLFKEIGFSLNDIKKIILNPKFDKRNALKKHKDLLMLKRDHIDDLIWLLDKLIEGKKYMSFDEFRKKEIEETMLKSFKKCMDKYRKYLVDYYGDEQEGERIYKKLIAENEDVILKNVIKYYGSVSAYNEVLSKEVDPNNTNKDYQNKVRDIIDKIANNKRKGIDSEYIQEIIKSWQLEIEKVFYVKTKSIIFDIGNGYLNDVELIEQTDKKYGNGTANFIGKAICLFCDS